MENDKVNPWVRTDLHNYNEHTLGLIHPERGHPSRKEYMLVMHELQVAGEGLAHALEISHKAQVRHDLAKLAVAEFFTPHLG